MVFDDVSMSDIDLLIYWEEMHSYLCMSCFLAFIRNTSNPPIKTAPLTPFSHTNRMRYAMPYINNNIYITERTFIITHKSAMRIKRHYWSVNNTKRNPNWRTRYTRRENEDTINQSRWHEEMVLNKKEYFVCYIQICIFSKWKNDRGERERERDRKANDGGLDLSSVWFFPEFSWCSSALSQSAITHITIRRIKFSFLFVFLSIVLNARLNEIT